jgi:hypothetical protein
MWTNETVFSKGDLMDNKLYDTFINRFYEGSYADRYAHINNMIDRLQEEKKILLSNAK